MPLTTRTVRNAAAILHDNALKPEEDRVTFKDKELFDISYQADRIEVIKRYGQVEGLPKLSHTWLKSFMAKYQFSYKSPTAFQKVPYSQVATDIKVFVVKLTYLLSSGNYDLDLVINADQTPVYRAAIPGRVIGFVGSATRVAGVSGERHRVTVMLAVTALGVFLAPYLVGKSVADKKQSIVDEFVYRNPSVYRNFDVAVKAARTRQHQLAASSSVPSPRMASPPEHHVIQPLTQFTASSWCARSLDTKEEHPVSAPFGPSSARDHQVVTPVTMTSASSSSSSTKPRPKKPGNSNGTVHAPGRADISEIREPVTLNSGPTPPGEAPGRSTRGGTTSTFTGLVTRSGRAVYTRNRAQYAEINEMGVESSGTGAASAPVASTERTSDLGSSFYRSLENGTWMDSDSDSDVEVGDGTSVEEEYVRKDKKQVEFGSSERPDVDAVIQDRHLFKSDPQVLETVMQTSVERYKTAHSTARDRPPNSHDVKADSVSPLDTVYSAYNDKAWFTSQIFISWLERVVLPQRKDPNKRILLLIDCCSLHRTKEVHDFCRAHRIDVLLIPAYCTAFLQPLDIGINRLMKDFLRNFTMGRIYYEHNDVGEHERDAKYLTESRFQCALLSCLNEIKASAITNSFRHMIEKSCVNPTSSPSCPESTAP